MFESKFLPAKIWAKSPFTVRMVLVISGEKKKFSQGLHQNERAFFPNPLKL